MESNNIITFPLTTCRPTTAPTVQQIDANIRDMKMFHVQETLNVLAPIIFTQLNIAGFGLDKEQTESATDIKQGAFIVEALKSMMLLQYGIHHPFQHIAENVFSYEDGSEVGILTIVDSLNINLSSNAVQAVQQTS